MALESNEGGSTAARRAEVRPAKGKLDKKGEKAKGEKGKRKKSFPEEGPAKKSHRDISAFFKKS